MIKYCYCGCWLVLFSAGTVLAQPADQSNIVSHQQVQDQQRAEARDWLERMALAMEHLNYRGTFVYSHSGQLQSLGVVHMRDSNGIRERLYSLDGDTREVHRNNNLVHAVAPEQDNYSQLNYRQFTRLPSGQLLQGESRYRFQLGKQQRIASLLAQQISIEPKDGFRYGYELWLEERTGMLLKQVMLDEHDQVLEKLVFTNLELGAEIDDRDLLEAAAGAAEHAVKPLADTVSQPRWRPAQLPNGFELLAHQRSSAGDEDPLEHLMYSDGLANVSVYLEPEEVTRADAEYPPSSYGVVNIYSRTVNGMHVTALGAVPYRTLRMIGGSIHDSSHLQATVGPTAPEQPAAKPVE